MIALALLASASALSFPSPARIQAAFKENRALQAQQAVVAKQGVPSLETESPAGPTMPDMPCFHNPPQTVNSNDLTFCTAFNGQDSCCTAEVDTYLQQEASLELAFVGLMGYFTSCMLESLAPSVQSGKCNIDGKTSKCHCLPASAMDPAATGYMCLTGCDLDNGYMCATKSGSTYSSCVMDTGDSSGVAGSGSSAMPTCPTEHAATAQACSTELTAVAEGQICASTCDPDLSGQNLGSFCAETCATLAQTCYPDFMTAIGCSAEDFSCLFSDNSSSASALCYDDALGTFREPTPDTGAASSVVPSLLVALVAVIALAF